MKRNHQKNDDTELLKAVAQAWYGHSGSSKAAATAAETSEFDAHRMYFKGKPSRFKLEAMRRATTRRDECGRSWDFGKSLWDSYEIISVSKKLERGLALNEPFSEERGGAAAVRPKESKNSLRNLFNRMSSRRFSEVDD